MTLTLPRPDEGSPQVGDEIAWRRELKQLRIRVAQLEAERGRKQQPSIEVKRGDVHGYRCGHPCGVEVDDKLPIVQCAACGSTLDPIDVLRDYANHERNFCYSLDHLRKERNDLHFEVEKLKKLRSRLRSHARKLLPPVPARPGENEYMRLGRADDQLDRALAETPAEIHPAATDYDTRK